MTIAYILWTLLIGDYIGWCRGRAALREEILKYDQEQRIRENFRIIDKIVKRLEKRLRSEG